MKTLILIISIVIVSLFPVHTFASTDDSDTICKYEETDLGSVYLQYTLDNLSLQKNLYLKTQVENVLIDVLVNDFCIKNNCIVYSVDNSVLVYDMDTKSIRILTNDVSARNLAVYNNYIYVVDDKNGMSQLIVISFDDGVVTKTNYTNVNKFTVSDSGLNIDMRVSDEKISETGTSSLTITSSDALSDADNVDNAETGFENINDNSVSLMQTNDMILNATVSLTPIQPAMFVMDTLYVTQGAYGSYSHSGNNAFDLDGSLGAGAPPAAVKAPFDGTVKYKETDYNAVWFESNSIVQYANGSTGYMTVLMMHDNDISNIYAGMTVSQGQAFYNEGGKGPSGTNQFGVHLHIECINGNAGSYAWAKRGDVYPSDALYLYSSTNVSNSGGYTWTTWTGESSFFDFWNFNDSVLSGTYKIWFKETGYGTCDVNIDVNGQVLTTLYPDANGYFAYNLDTTKYNDGTYQIGAIIRSTSGSEKTVSRTIQINNGRSFDFWNFNDTVLTDTYKFWFKEIGYGTCDVNIDINGQFIATLPHPDANGYFSCDLDTTKYNDGTYQINAIIRSTSGIERKVSRSFTISNGMFFDFWDFNNTELTGTQKIWIKEIGYGSSFVKLNINNQYVATMYPDVNGYVSYNLNTLKYVNGNYKIAANLNWSDKSRTVERTFTVKNPVTVITKKSNMCSFIIPANRLSKGKIITALYKNKKLIAIKFTDCIDISSALSVEVPYDVEPDTAKVMVWGDLSGINPLSFVEVTPGGDWVTG